MALQHLRSSTANKRPTPAAMSDGQLAMNTNLASPGLFFKDSNGDSVKIGPVHVGTTAPNVTPGAGGQAGNSVGEAWLDTTAANPILKVFNGSAFVAVQPVGTGTVVSTTDTGTVTSTMILDGTILNADINASAAIAGTKISPDFGSQTVTTTGVVSAALGAAATPSLTFTSDLNTGIFSPGADQVAISTNGTEKLIVLSNGNVGIGSSSPSAKLDVEAANFVGGPAIGARFNASNVRLGFNIGNSNGFAYIGSNTNNKLSVDTPTYDLTGHFASQLRLDSGQLIFNNAPIGTAGNDITFTNRLTITSAGAVGIGTTSPSDSQGFGNALEMRGSTGSAYYSATSDNATRAYFATFTGGGFAGTETNHPLIIRTNNTERARIRADGMFEVKGAGTAGSSPAFSVNGSAPANSAVIDSSGRLLVGTSTTASYNHLFQVRNDDGAVAELLTSSATAGLGPYLALSRSRGSAGSPTVVSSGDTVGDLFFSGYSGSAYVGAAEIKVEVDGTPGANDMPGRLVFFTTADGAATPTERMRIGQNGQVFIGTTTNPSGFAAARLICTATSGSHYGVHVNATTAVSTALIEFSAVNTEVGNIVTNGTSNVSYNTTSDYRLKENVTAVTDGIARLQQLKPSRFNFIVDPGHTVDGFIAHEAQVVVPECVTGERDAIDDDGNPIYQGIDQSKLVPLLTAALQEAIAKIESLEARLTAAGI